jgi:putative Mg2+ transporter-C (MgtC) family protein
MENILLEYIFRLCLSVLCGFFLGIERKLRRHTVGIRTLVLISISSSLFGMLSVFIASQGIGGGDPGRVAAAVTTGIGFLGGGAILRHGLNIRGLTTAAIIFADSAIGLACGIGFYIPAIAALFLCLFMLITMSKLEYRFFSANKTKIIHLKFSETIIDQDLVLDILKQNGIVHQGTDVICSNTENILEVLYTVKIPRPLDTVKVVNMLKNIKSLLSVTITDE